MAQGIAGVGGNVGPAGKYESAINTATRDELLSVQGIGPVLDDKIIAGRPYRSERDALERGVITENIFNALREELLKGRRAG